MKAWIDHQTYSIKPTDSWRIQNAKKAGHAEDYTLEQIAEAIGRGQTVTPAAYHTIPNPTEKNPDAVSFVCDEKQLFFLDFDEGDTFPSKSAFQRCAEKGIFPAFWYRSFSSTEQKEKYRLCFLCDEPITDEGKAHRIQRGLMEIFPQSDRACKDLCRLFYGTNKGVFILDGAPSFSYADICQITPEQPRTQSAPPRLNYAAQPGNWLQENISDILVHISPDCCYADWLRVGAALHYEGFPFSLFDSWSRGGSKYKTGEPEKKWNSFRDSGSALVTGATLTAMAKENGWRKPERVNSYQKPAGGHQSDYKPQSSTYTPEAVEAPQEAQEAPQETPEQYMGRNAAAFISEFMDGIGSSVNTPAITTGFQTLDEAFDGGLYPGLYFIGAISSLGKTTFCLQIADQIAAAGNDVLIFSLEMARGELMAKSISRMTFQRTTKAGNGTRYAKTTRGITDGKRWAHYSNSETRLIAESVTEYGKAIAPRIWIEEGIGDIGVEQVRAAVEKHIKLTGRKPFVLIDYVQILAPYDVRASDKQNTDKAVLELKRISRDFNIPIMGISSLNRESYTEPISMRAFKESGSIEYTSDILLGLQYSGMDSQDGETEKTRIKRVRTLMKEAEQRAAKGGGVDIQLKILKNRNGRKGLSLGLTFYPMFNCFTERTPGQFEELYGDEPTPFDDDLIEIR